MLKDHSFGRRTKVAREDAGMSQSETVKAASRLEGVVHHFSIRTLQRIEAGKCHTQKWIRQLKRIFPALR